MGSGSLTVGLLLRHAPGAATATAHLKCVQRIFFATTKAYKSKRPSDSDDQRWGIAHYELLSLLIDIQTGCAVAYKTTYICTVWRVSKFQVYQELYNGVKGDGMGWVLWCYRKHVSWIRFLQILDKRQMSKNIWIWGKDFVWTCCDNHTWIEYVRFWAWRKINVSKYGIETERYLSWRKKEEISSKQVDRHCNQAEAFDHKNIFSSLNSLCSDKEQNIKL